MRKNFIMVFVLVMSLELLGCGANEEKKGNAMMDDKAFQAIIASKEMGVADQSGNKKAPSEKESAVIEPAFEKVYTEADILKLANAKKEPVIVYTNADIEELDESEVGFDEVYAEDDIIELKERRPKKDRTSGEMDVREMEALQKEIARHQSNSTPEKTQPAAKQGTTAKAKAKPVAKAGAPAKVESAATIRPNKNIRIKVLNGNGNADSARAMRSKLETLGYKVERIDDAPSPKFSNSVVFYAKGFEKQATAIVKSLGGSIVTKPLTWQSVFDLIVVTGNMD